MKLFVSVISLLLMCCGSFSVMAQNPSLRFDSTIHDFGQVLISDGALTCSFVAHNTSSSPVTIQSVTTSCGCTNVKWSHDAIQPGQSTTISATYSNDEGPYPFDKTITVSVVGSSKPYILHLRGIVQKEIKSDSQVYTAVYGEAIGLMADKFKTGNLEQGGSRSDQTTVANLSSAAVKITFESVSDGLSLAVSPNPIPAKSHATLRYTVESRADKWGYNDYVAIPSINGKSSGKKLMVTAFTAENFSSLTKEQKAKGSRPIFQESTFSFGHKKQGEVVNAAFTCENKGAATLTVHKVDVDCKGVKAGTFPQIAPGAKAAFSVSVDTKNLPKGEALVMVTLTTNSPLRPIVVLCIAGWID